MGWGRTLLLGDLGTQLNVSDVERDLEEVKRYLREEQSHHRSEQSAISALQKENHELKLYVVTLIRLLVDKNLLSETELNQFVNIVDPDKP